MVRDAAHAEALIRLLPYAQWNVEGGREVLRALEGLGERAVAALSRTLADSGRARFLRLAAAWVLGRIGSPAAKAALRPGTGDDDPQVAAAAAMALDRPHLPLAA